VGSKRQKCWRFEPVRRVCGVGCVCVCVCVAFLCVCVCLCLKLKLSKDEVFQYLELIFGSDYLGFTGVTSFWPPATFFKCKRPSTHATQPTFPSHPTPHAPHSFHPSHSQLLTTDFPYQNHNSLPPPPPSMCLHASSLCRSFAALRV